MRRRDGLLIAPILLVGVLLASLIVSPKPLSEPMLWAVTALSGAAILVYAGLAWRSRGRVADEARGCRPFERRSRGSPDDGDA